MNKHPFAVTVRLSLLLLVGFLFACNGRATLDSYVSATCYRAASLFAAAAR
jgi:hypothetical protein